MRKAFLELELHSVVDRVGDVESRSAHAAGVLRIRTQQGVEGNRRRTETRERIVDDSEEWILHQRVQLGSAKTPVRWIETVHVRNATPEVKMRAFSACVVHLEYGTAGQCSLDGEIPLLVLRILVRARFGSDSLSEKRGRALRPSRRYVQPIRIRIV